MKKFLLKTFDYIAERVSKLPIHLKSKMHDGFHSTLGQIYNRDITQFTNKGMSKFEIIEKVSGQKISELSKEDLEIYTKWLEGRELELSQIDESFKGVLPSLFPQRYYRGITGTPEEIQNLKKGDIFTDSGYSWYTPKKSYAEDFSQYINGSANPENCTVIQTVIPAFEKISRDIELSLEEGISGINPFSSMNIVTQRNVRYEVLDKQIKNNKTYLKLKYLGV